MKVNGKTIVVTGGGSGIGRELVLELISRGATVAAADINEEALKETKSLVEESKKDRLSLHIVNIADQERAQAFPDEVIEKHGSVDGIINNAGIIQPFIKINDLDFEKIRRVMEINFFGTLNMTKSFLPSLLTRPEAHITNISSMGGFMPFPGQSIYGAAKAGVKLMTEALSSELINTNVKVSVVFPGAINTNIMSNSGVESRHSKEDAENGKFKALSPAKAASTIIDGIEKNKARVYVGKDSIFMNLLYRTNPKFATRLIAKQMGSMLD